MPIQEIKKHLKSGKFVAIVHKTNTFVEKMPIAKQSVCIFNPYRVDDNIQALIDLLTTDSDEVSTLFKSGDAITVEDTLAKLFYDTIIEFNVYKSKDYLIFMPVEAPSKLSWLPHGKVIDNDDDAPDDSSARDLIKLSNSDEANRFHWSDYINQEDFDDVMCLGEKDGNNDISSSDYSTSTPNTGFIDILIDKCLVWDDRHTRYQFNKDSMLGRFSDLVKVYNKAKQIKTNTKRAVGEFINQIMLDCKTDHVSFFKTVNSPRQNIKVISGIRHRQPTQTSLFSANDSESNGLEPINDNQFIKQISAVCDPNLQVIEGSDKRSCHPEYMKLHNPDEWDISDCFSEEDHKKNYSNYLLVDNSLPKILKKISRFSNQHREKIYYNIFEIGKHFVVASISKDSANNDNMSIVYIPMLLVHKYAHYETCVMKLLIPNSKLMIFGKGKKSVDANILGNIPRDSVQCAFSVVISNTSDATGNIRRRTKLLEKNKAFHDYIADL